MELRYLYVFVLTSMSVVLHFHTIRFQFKINIITKVVLSLTNILVKFVSRKKNSMNK